MCMYAELTFLERKQGILFVQAYDNVLNICILCAVFGYVAFFTVA